MFGLMGEDYELFSAANANSAAQTSFAYDFVIDLGVTGMGTDVSGNLTGSGVLSGEMGSTDMMGLLFSTLVDGSLTFDGQTTPAAIEVRVVGDTAYFRLGDGEEWFSTTLEELTQMGTQMSGMMMPGDPAAMLGTDPMATPDTDAMMESMMGMEGMNEAIMGLMSLDANEFVSLTRLEDMDGLAHFSLGISVGDLLSQEELLPLFGMAMSQAGMGSDEMTDQQMEQMSMMMGMMFADAVITFDQYVDPATELVERAVLTIDFPIAAAMTGGEEDGQLDLVFDIDLMSFGEMQTVEAPANAQPLTEMMSGMMGGMGS